MNTVKTTLALCIFLLPASEAISQIQPPESGSAPLKQLRANTVSYGITHEQADAILRELQEIRKILTSDEHDARKIPESSTKVKMTMFSGMQAIGEANAPVTMVEFTDYQCPYCKRFRADVFGQIKSTYIDTGKVWFVTRDLPLVIHPQAQIAAEAARCASDQHRSWELREMMFTSAADLSNQLIYTYAANVGLDMNPFRSCVENKKYADAIKQDNVDAQALGIFGTPTFIIGKSAPDSINGVKIVGALPFSDYASAIDAALSMR